MTIATAIQRIQALALASSSDMKIAPDNPVDNAATLPMSMARLGGGQSTAANSTTNVFIPSIFVDFYFNRSWMKKAFEQIDTIVPAFANRLAGDPTLNGTRDTIVFPVLWSEPEPVDLDDVQTLRVRFTIPVKTLETPVST